MAENFAATVAAWVAAEKARQLAVFRESAQRVVNAAQEPVSAGGNLPVVTGYLRASGKASIGEPGYSVTYRPDGNTSYSYSPAAANLTMASASLDDVIYFTWTANYAPYVEARRGFVRLAAQRWTAIVRQVSIEAAARAGT